jgi:hypothetical protein
VTKEKHTPVDRFKIFLSYWPICTYFLYFYRRTKLSKALITDPVKIELCSAADLKIKFGTNIRTGIVSTTISLMYLLR